MLREVFGAYAAVIEVQILGQGGAAGSAATVRLSSIEDAIWMMTNLNGNIPQGLETPLNLRYHKPFAALQSVHVMADDQGLCNGVGFVRFGFPQDAQIAVSTLNGNRLPDGNILYVSAADAAAVMEQVNAPLIPSNFTNNQDQAPGQMYGLVDGLIPLDDSHQIQGVNNTQVS